MAMAWLWRGYGVAMACDLLGQTRRASGANGGAELYQNRDEGRALTSTRNYEVNSKFNYSRLPIDLFKGGLLILLKEACRILDKDGIAPA